MKPKTMILLGLAITCGLGASYMTSRLLAERQQTPETPETVEFLVARQNLSVHTKLTKPEELFEVKTVAKGDEPPDAIRDFDAIRNKKLKTGRNRGESITASNLYDKDGLEVPEGHKAIGVPVNLQTTAHGLATLPGSRVDLHLTIKAQNVFDTKAVVLLENVLVLAADIRVNAEGEIFAPAQVVTFAMKSEDIGKVNVAMDMGTIRLIMRNQNDKGFAKVRVFTGHEIIEKKDEPQQVAKVEPVKPEPKVEPKKIDPPPVVDTRPKVTKHHYDIVNGDREGKRTVERVYYYMTEDGRSLPEDAPEVQEALRPLEATPAPAPRQKATNPPVPDTE